MGCAVSKHSRFSCRRPEQDNGAPYTPSFDVAPRRCFKFVSYERRDIQCGSGRAEVTENALNLFSLYHSETIPLNCIRRYGFESKCFMFETGQRCPSGEATHRIWMEKAEDIMIELDRTLAWRRQMLEKAIMLEEEAAKAKDLKEPASSSLLQRRAAMMNDYVTEPVVMERRRRLRKRREKESFVSSDTDSRSDLERAVANTGNDTPPAHSRSTTGSSDSPKSGTLRSNHSESGSKVPSPSKGHRSRLKGESSSEITSARHRHHRPARARSRHSNSFKPGMGTYFEASLFADTHSESMDTLDFSSSDVGATDCSTTGHYRSPSSSTNDIDSLSVRSQLQASCCLEAMSSSAVSSSPTSTKTIVPSPCSVIMLKDCVIEAETDSDQTLCAASPSSSTDAKFSPPLFSTSSGSATTHTRQGGSDTSSSSSLPHQQAAGRHRQSTGAVASSENFDSVDVLTDSSDCPTPPYPETDNCYCSEAAETDNCYCSEAAETDNCYCSEAAETNNCYCSEAAETDNCYCSEAAETDNCYCSEAAETDNCYCSEAATSSAITMCSSSATLQDGDMKELTDSPQSLSDGSPPEATSFSSLDTASLSSGIEISVVFSDTVVHDTASNSDQAAGEAANVDSSSSSSSGTEY